MNRLSRALLTTLFLVLISLHSSGAEPTAEHTSSLFDGQTLNGWTLENDCKASVKDGLIVLDAGDGWIRSDHQYGDFKLHVEWRALKAHDCDAGIFIRTLAGGSPFPKQSYQINLQEGREGNIPNLPGATSTGLIKQGEWNTFDATVIGDVVELVINGKPAYRAAGLKIARGHVGIQVEVPKGGSYHFKNIRITELGYRSLFNGHDFAGWEGADGPIEKSWLITDGVLECNGVKKTWLRSDKTYSDFNFRFDYQVPADGNSGIFVRIPKDGNHHRENESLPPAGFEVQLLDDSAPKHRDLKDYQYSGGVYDIAGVTAKVSKAPGQWNTMEINCRGQHVTIIHNGVMIADAPVEKFPALARRQTEGYLGLQNHGTPVKLRNLRIGPAIVIGEATPAAK
jgi:hypothetical protein